MVSMPAARRRSEVLGPTPQRSEIGSGARKASSPPGADDGQPVGFLAIGGDLGHRLARRDTAGDRELGLALDAIANPLADFGRSCAVLDSLGDVDERFVDESGSTSGETSRRIDIT